MTRYRCEWHDAEIGAAGLPDHAACFRRGKVFEIPRPGDVSAVVDLDPPPVSLFDGPAAQAAKREAMDTVDHNADADWKDLADSAIKTVALRGIEFTTDDIWELLDASGVPRPHEPKAIGPRMKAAANAGIVEATGRIASSTQRQGHGRTVRIYRPGPKARSPHWSADEIRRAGIPPE